MAEFAISQGAKDFDWGLSSTCYGGQYNMAKLMITYGAKDWSRAITSAKYACHANIVELIKSQQKLYTESLIKVQ